MYAQFVEAKVFSVRGCIRTVHAAVQRWTLRPIKKTKRHSKEVNTMTERIVNGKLIVSLSEEDVKSLIDKWAFGKNGCSPDCEIRCAAADVIIPLVNNTKCD